MEKIQLLVPSEASGQRIDAWLAGAIEGVSRSRVQTLLKSGDILLNGAPAKANYRLAGGEHIEFEDKVAEHPMPVAESIELPIVFEDEWLLIVNKPAGMATHGMPGRESGTLVNALLQHCEKLSQTGGARRPGIVHRLDKDTSGLLLVAKDDETHEALSAALKRREIKREYIAVIVGQPTAPSGTIDAPLGRSNSTRSRFSIQPGGRKAITHWEIQTWGHGVSILRLRLETGRTHQIRVHLASRGWPVVGDKVYGVPAKHAIEAVPHKDVPLVQALSRVKRQQLHAARLEFTHPSTGEPMEFESAPPPDMQQMLDAIRPLKSMADMQQEMEAQKPAAR